MVSILDRQKLLTAFKNPLKPTDEEILAPMVGYSVMSPDQGAHTVIPYFGVPVPGFQGHTELRKRDLLLVSSEAGRADNCGQNFPEEHGRRAPHLAFMLDITHEPAPWPLSTLRVQETQGDYCGRGGRFGVHSSSESFYPPVLRKDRDHGLVQRRRAHLGYPRSLCGARGRLSHSGTASRRASRSVRTPRRKRGASSARRPPPARAGRWPSPATWRLTIAV